MSISPWKPGGLPVAEEQARRARVEPAVPVHLSMQRVKVYRLTDDGKWDDQGTGHVTIDYIQGSGELALIVVDEEDNDTLLLHNITSDDIYRKQEETIISWTDPEKALDLALSFQEAAGCSYIWDSMHNIQQNLQRSVLGPQIGPCPASESREASRNSLPHDESLVSVGELKDLPLLEISSLPLISKIIVERGAADQMRIAELISQDHEFFPKLVNLFRLCENLKNMDALHMIFKLVKGIILLNNSAIFEKIFSDAHILDIIGALEYDPEVSTEQSHRGLLKELVVFKEDMPITNPYLVSKIHQTYRVAYIKDVILPRLGDATLASLKQIIHANNAVIARLLMDDASFIPEVFTRMRSSNISVESKRKLVLFLQEFCDRSRSLHPGQQSLLSRDLISEGVFDIISYVLQSQDKVLVSAGTDILMHFLNQDPNLVTSYIAHQEEKFQGSNSLLGILIQGMVIDSDEEMLCQYCAILRILLDSFAENMATNSKGFIQGFYEKHLHKLIDVIASACQPKSTTRSISGSVGVGKMVEKHSAKPEILLRTCELLCSFVRQHSCGIKLNFFTRNSIEKILTLTHRREKTLVVAAVRFMRAIIGRKDEFLISQVIKFNLLKPIIEVFVENGFKYNMLHSGVLELLEYIRKENMESLIEYVSESFWDQLMKFERFESIQAFKLNYEQIMESAKTKKNTSVVDTRKKAEERAVDKQEGDYINKDSYGEDSEPVNDSDTGHIPARPKSGGLVDYDDSDNECFNPPPKKPKLEARSSCVKIVDAVNVMGIHSDLEDEKKPPLSPSISMKSSEDNEDLGGGSPGSKSTTCSGKS